MSVKEKQEKSKKVSDVRSLRHEKKSQSVSSLSSHIGQLERTWNKLLREQENAVKAIIHYSRIRGQFIGRTDKFSREEAEDAEGNLQMWQEKVR